MDILGATLIDIYAYTSSSSKDIAVMYIISAVIGMLSAVFLVPLHNRYNTFFLMAVASFMAGIVMAASPWSTNVTFFICLTALLRAPLSVIDTGM